MSVYVSLHKLSGMEKHNIPILAARLQISMLSPVSSAHHLGNSLLSGGQGSYKRVLLSASPRHCDPRNGTKDTCAPRNLHPEL